MHTVPEKAADRVPQPAVSAPSTSAAARLTRAGAAPLTGAVATSLADRITSDRASSAELADAVAGLSDVAFLELARHALEAALEALDSQPALTVDLLPGTANAVRAQIARGCIGEQVLRTQGYVLAEIDYAVWEQLLDADLRSAPTDTLGADEAADRQRSVLADLGIRHAELSRYRDDRRVVLAMSDLGLSNLGLSDLGLSDLSTLSDLGPVTI